MQASAVVSDADKASLGITVAQTPTPIGPPTTAPICTIECGNRFRNRTMRDAVKEVLEKIAHGIIDRTASKDTIHKNQAARRKSRLNARLKTRVLSGAEAGTKSAAKKTAKKS